MKFLVRALVKQVLLEVREDPKGWDLRYAYRDIEADPGPFNIKKFIPMSQKERLYYLHTRRDTKLLGEGSGRIVYRISDNLVIKVAKSPKGVAQNRSEKLIVNCGYPRYYAKIRRSAKDNSWVIMEQGDRIGAGEFRRVMGFSLAELGQALHYVQAEKEKQKKIPSKEKRAYEYLKGDEWFRGLARMMLACKLIPGGLNTTIGS